MSDLRGYQDCYEVCRYDVPFDADALNRMVGCHSSGAEYSHPMESRAASLDPWTVLEMTAGFQ